MYVLTEILLRTKERYGILLISMYIYRNMDKMTTAVFGNAVPLR
jgi:hypothetical protein